MKKYLVEITDSALADMEALYDHIAVTLQSPENAIEQYNRIADGILTLDMFPDRYPLIDSEPEYSMGIHRMIIDNFLIFYVIDPEVVTIIAVLYGGSDVLERLQGRRSK